MPSRKPAAGAKTRRPAIWGGLREGDLVVVDSAPIICVLEDHPQFAARFTGLFEAFDAGQLRVAISTITLAEVLVGPLRHAQEALARRYARALESLEVVPLSAEIAATAARLRATTRLRLPDAIQAATALDVGAAALVTHDRDFSSLAGLPVLMGDS